jgi:hypothetical protein
VLEKQSKLGGKKSETKGTSKSNGAQKRATSNDIHRYVLILFQNGENIDRESVRDIQKQLDEIVTTAPEVTDIDVWIESPGGDAHAAYKLAIDLRSRCRNLRAVVPDFAKSAATLLILGMDKVFMKAAAELGPLDVQIPHPDREDVIISALDVADSLDFLARTAFGYAVSGGAVILEITGLRRSEVLNSTLPFVAQFLLPIVAKHDPHLLHQATNQLRIAERYALDLLARRAEPFDETEAKKLVHKLIHHYPAHETLITRREARRANLPIANLEDYVDREALNRVYYKFLEDNESMVFVVDAKTMEKLTQTVSSGQENENETTTEGSEQALKQEAEQQTSGSGGPPPLSARA